MQPRETPSSTPSQDREGATREAKPDGSKRDIVLTTNAYDGAGNLIQETTGGVRTTVTHAVDATGRTTRSTLDPTGLNRVTTYDYDGDDRIIQQTRTIDPQARSSPRPPTTTRPETPPRRRSPNGPAHGSRHRPTTPRPDHLHGEPSWQRLRRESE